MFLFLKMFPVLLSFSRIYGQYAHAPTKSGAKVLLFFDIAKKNGKINTKYMHFAKQR